ncbi:MAG: hypothetical protein H0T11_01835 [Chthoniobacterales bacterium]|nr:hypothetical protein [Chthoniobacterales bacterium]
MDAIYEKLGERIVEAARTAAAIHLHQSMTVHSFRPAPSISGANQGRVTEDAAASDALVDDRPAGTRPHTEGLALPHAHRAGRLPRRLRHRFSR